MSKSLEFYSNKIDIHALLRGRRQIAIIWDIADVQTVRPDLSNDQAWEVLLDCERHHDCEYGFTWMFLEDTADSLFPAPAKPIDK